MGGRMQIIFDSEEEKYLKKFVGSDSCPSDIWLKDSCAYGQGNCENCWRTALEAIEKKEE